MNVFRVAAKIAMWRNRCWEQMLLVFPFQCVLGFCAWLYMDPVHGINKFKNDLSDA